MKTEEQIRSHRDALKIAIDAPCSCAGTVHEQDCHTGQLMMTATMMTLSWILDEMEELNEQINELRLFAEEQRARDN